MTILIPMAGNGQRFKDAGYDQPKPLIDVLGRTMIERVLENVTPTRVSNFPILIARKEHEIPPFLGNVIDLDAPTRGAVDTVLKASEFLNDTPFILANCDQLADINPDEFSYTDLDMRLVTFKSQNTHHSYVEIEDELVTRIVEKPETPPSHQAVAGIYYFASGKRFKEAAERIIREDKRVNNEFYVSTVIQELIDQGAKVGTYEANCAMLGTPAELQSFIMAAKTYEALCGT